jgi:hypothetical protein
MATYARLKDGSWGVRGGEGEIRAGQDVVVTRRDGT